MAATPSMKSSVRTPYLSRLVSVGPPFDDLLHAHDVDLSVVRAERHAKMRQKRRLSHSSIFDSCLSSAGDSGIDTHEAELPSS